MVKITKKNVQRKNNQKYSLSHFINTFQIGASDMTKSIKIKQKITFYEVYTHKLSHI